MIAYFNWLKKHHKKHKKILDKLKNFSKEEIIDYFSYDNLKEKEAWFCPLFEKNKKCHNIKDLNCYMCGCIYFRIKENESYCSIGKGHQKYSNGFLHQSCISCIIPHKKRFISKYFKKDFLEMMKNCKDI